MEMTGKDGKLIHGDARPGDIKHSLADISKAKSVGYNPRYNLKKGLTETVRRFSHIF